MLNMGELVTVVEHDSEGRILRFVKTPIPLGTAEEMKAAAFAENERKKDQAVLRDTKALVATAKSLRLAASTRVVDEPALEDDPPPPASAAPRQLAPPTRVARDIHKPEQAP